MRAKTNISTNPSPFKCQHMKSFQKYSSLTTMTCIDYSHLNYNYQQTLQDFQDQISFGNKNQRLPTETDKARGGFGNSLFQMFESYLDNNLRVNKEGQQSQEQSKFHSRKNSDILYQDMSKLHSPTNIQGLSRKNSNIGFPQTVKKEEQRHSDYNKPDRQQKDKNGQNYQQQTQTGSNNYINLIEQVQRDLQKKTITSNQVTREPSPSIYQSPNNNNNNESGLIGISKKIETLQNQNFSSSKQTHGPEQFQDLNNKGVVHNKHKRNSSLQAVLSNYQVESNLQPEYKKSAINIYATSTNKPKQSYSIYQPSQNIYSQQNQIQINGQQQNTLKPQPIVKPEHTNSYLPHKTANKNENEPLKSSAVGQYSKLIKKTSVDLRHVDLNSHMKQSIAQHQQNGLTSPAIPLTETKAKFSLNLNQVNQPSSSSLSKTNAAAGAPINSSNNFTKYSSNKENDDSYQTGLNQNKRSNTDLSIFYTSRKDKDGQNPSNRKSNARSFLQTNQSNLDYILNTFQGGVKQDTKISCDALDDSINQIICQKINFQSEGGQFQNGDELKTIHINNEHYNDLETLKPDEHNIFQKPSDVCYGYYQNEKSIEEQVIFNSSVEQLQQDNTDTHKSSDENNDNVKNNSSKENTQMSDQDFSKVKINEEISSKQIKTLSNIFKICDTKNLPHEYLEQLLELKEAISHIITQNQ